MLPWEGLILEQIVFTFYGRNNTENKTTIGSGGYKLFHGLFRLQVNGVQFGFGGKIHWINRKSGT